MRGLPATRRKRVDERPGPASCATDSLLSAHTPELTYWSPVKGLAACALEANDELVLRPRIRHHACAPAVGSLHAETQEACVVICPTLAVVMAPTGAAVSATVLTCRVVSDSQQPGASTAAAWPTHATLALPLLVLGKCGTKCSGKPGSWGSMALITSPTPFLNSRKTGSRILSATRSASRRR